MIVCDSALHTTKISSRRHATESLADGPFACSLASAMALSQLRNCGRLARLALQQGCQQVAGGLPTASAAAGSTLRLTCVAAARAPPPWHPAFHSRGFAADAGAGGAASGQRKQKQPTESIELAWAQDGAFVVRAPAAVYMSWLG